LGWCSYIAGFSLLKNTPIKHYVGIDIIDSVCYNAKYTSLGICSPEKINIYNCQSEIIMNIHNEFNTTYKEYFDLIFFSPPYYRMELYKGVGQSTTIYKTYDEWLINYWEKTVIMCKNVLNPKGGIFSYIVSPFDNYNLPDDLLKISNKYFLLQNIIPIYNKNVNSTKHREPDDKLYIYITKT
jgi:tRNA1(Val) A37 N6-methylase TrmN6